MLVPRRIQAMQARRIATRNRENVRLARLLKRRIVDALRLEAMAKQAHWEVRGPNHAALHGLFDQMYGNLDAHVAELAEVVRELGGDSLGESGPGAQGPALVPFNEESSTGHGQVADLEHQLDELRRKLHRSQTKVIRLGNAHAAVACSGLMRDVDMYYQMLRLHLRPPH
jgi:starvation-inducible DNA-binding protein